MVRLAELDQLEARKQLHVAKSEIYRGMLDVEMQTVGAATAWIPKTVNFLRSPAALLLLCLPLVHLLGRKKMVSLKFVTGKAWLGWQLFQKLRPLWRFARRL